MRFRSGSTVPYVVERLCQPPHNANNFDRWFIPTGFQSKELIVKAGLNLGDVDQFPSLDVTIDGADEVDVSSSPSLVRKEAQFLTSSDLFSQDELNAIKFVLFQLFTRFHDRD